MTRRRKLLIGFGIIACVFFVILFVVWRQGPSLKEQFMVDTQNGNNGGVVYSLYEGTFYSYEKNIVSIELAEKGGIFSGFVITPEIKIVKVTNNKDGDQREEERRIEDIPKGAQIRIMTNNTGDKTPSRVVEIQYQ